jgi:Rrf2 family protein
MKIGNSCQYGLMAVGYVATHSKDGNIMSDTIAKEYKMPLEYLLKILQQLVRAGILNSKRGPHGGFTMGKDPDQITLLDIFDAMEGPSSNQVFLLEQTKAPFALRMEKVCGEAIAEQNKVLGSVTLADLIGSSKK